METHFKDEGWGTEPKMKKHNKAEVAMRYGIPASLIGVGAWYFMYSPFKPEHGGEPVKIEIEEHFGEPKISYNRKKEEITDYIECILARNGADFNNKEEGHLIPPKRVIRYKRSDIASEVQSQFTEQEFAQPNLPFLEAGKDYILQFNCPPEVELGEALANVEVTYAGLRLEAFDAMTNIDAWDGKSDGRKWNSWFVKFKALTGKKTMKAKFKYEHGNRIEEFETDLIGRDRTSSYKKSRIGPGSQFAKADRSNGRRDQFPPERWNSAYNQQGGAHFNNGRKAYARGRA